MQCLIDEVFVMKKLIFLLCMLVVAGCGSDGGATIEWDGPVNASGYPDVEGEYSFKTGLISAICEGPGTSATDTGDPMVMNMIITQDKNRLLMVSADGKTDIPGVTLLEGTDATGNIELDGTFIITRSVAAIFDLLDIDAIIRFHTSGRFTLDGWSGTLKYDVSMDTLVACEASTTFTGRKI